MVIGLVIATGASVTASVLLLQVAVLPLVFKYSKSVQRKMVFSTCINYPYNLDYENPSKCNIIGARHFMIDFQSIADKCLIKLGVWHIIPCSMLKDVFIVRNYIDINQRLHENLKRTQKTVVLYCHGNSNHRGSPHRLQMYRMLQDMDFHVITFDYRGYGDSSSVRPTERGVVEDTLAVYSWLMQSLDQENRPMVLIWGHSLGTSIAAHLTAHLPSLCSECGYEKVAPPDALILEAPFNNLMEEIACHPFSKLVSWLPYYRETFIKPFVVSSEYSFDTDEYLTKVPKIPILILHSKGDKVVPHHLAEKLYDKIAASRDKGSAPLKFHTFERSPNVGHNNMCDEPELKAVVQKFLDEEVGSRLKPARIQIKI